MTESARFELGRPPGDDRDRLICADCGFVQYVNPKIVVGSVVMHEDRVLLCRRAIAPRRGYWTLPAGYLEERETVEQGAMREAREEACADIHIEGVLAIYSLPHLSQVQIMFRAVLNDPSFAPGPESLEAGLFAWDEIPWDELAFPSVRWALDHVRAWGHEGAPPVFSNPG